MAHGQIVGGFYQNVIPGEPSEHFAQKYIEDEADAGRPFVVVPDGVVSGAKDDGDGTFTNPAQATPEPTPWVLTSIDFQDHCIACLGALTAPSGTPDEKFMAGAERFGEIMEYVTDPAATYLVKTAKTRFDMAVARDAFGQADTAKFLALIASAMQDGETARILTTWPT